MVWSANGLSDAMLILTYSSRAATGRCTINEWCQVSKSRDVHAVVEKCFGDIEVNRFERALRCSTSHKGGQRNNVLHACRRSDGEDVMTGSDVQQRI